MQSQTELLNQISDSFHAGIGFAEFMSFATEEPGYEVLSQELHSARRWINRANQQSEPEHLEKIPEIVALLRHCAVVTEDCGYEFLAADFEHLADESICLGNGCKVSEVQAQ
jgi:hypothetical protein